MVTYVLTWTDASGVARTLETPIKAHAATLAKRLNASVRAKRPAIRWVGRPDYVPYFS